MDDAEGENALPQRVFQYVKDAFLVPIRIATSPPLLRTYIRTLLLFLTSTILFGTAVVAYTSFYYAYIPIRGIEVPVYLQYSHDTPLLSSAHDALVKESRGKRHPHGIASVDGLVSRQKYDVDVALMLPRSDSNLHAGNWMVGLELRGPSSRGNNIKTVLGWGDDWDVEDYSQGASTRTTKDEIGAEQGIRDAEKMEVLARSRRPGILTYRSWMSEVAFRAVRLPLFAIGWGVESESVKVGMMEGVVFEKGWRSVPASLRLELRSKVPLEVYTVRVRFVARLEGLRWAMYHHRLISAVVFIGAFWSVEVGVLLFTWALITFLFSGASSTPSSPEREKIKQEGTATPKTEPTLSEPPTPMSDTNRTFPTLSTQQPLKYESETKEERSTPALEDIPTREDAEADDEEDDFVLDEPVPLSAAGILTDSGIGTSLDSAGEKRGLSRRRSGRGGGGDG